MTDSSKVTTEEQLRLALIEMSALVEDMLKSNNLGNMCFQDYKRLNDAPIAARAAIARANRELLIRFHGEEDCHICGKPRIEKGGMICSYPHARVPVRLIDEAHPEGFSVWEPIREI